MEAVNSQGRPPASAQFQRSDRSGLQIFAALAAILALIGYLFWSGYQSAHREALTTSNNLTMILAAAIQADLDRARSDLWVFVPQVTAEDLAGHASEARRTDIETRMGAHLRSFPAVLNYRVFNEAGQSVFGAGSANPHAAINVADRQWFKQLRDVPGRDFAMSDVVIGKGTLDQTVLMGVAIRDGKGRFLGALNAAINLAHFQSEIDALDIGAKGMVAVRRNDNFSLVLRRPMVVGQINVSVSSELSRHIQSGQTVGGGDFTSPLDNQTRSYAFRTLTNFPLTVVVAVSAEDYLAPWRKQTALGGSVALVLIIALVVLHRRQHKARSQLVGVAEALRSSEGRLASEVDRFRQLLLTASDGIHILDAQGSLVLASRSFYHMLGYDADAPPSLHVSDWDSKWTRHELRDVVRRLIDAPTTFTTRHRRGDGTEIDVEINSRAVHLDGQNLLFASSRDITERQRSEQEIRTLLAYQRAILDNSPVGIAIIGLDRRLTEANAAFCRIYGREGENLAGESARILYGDDAHYDDLGRRAYPLITAGESFAEDVLMTRADGSAVWVHFVAHMVDMTQPSLGAVWAAEDINERKRLELDLKYSNEELEHFAYVASHDLRQPLRMVSSYLALIQRKIGASLDEETKTFMGFAIGGAKRMDRMIIDLLEYSRIGRTSADAAPVSLRAVVGRALANLEVAIAEAGATVTVPATLPEVTGYESELERLFQNLIGNALKFRSPDRAPLVTVACEETQQEWIIAISDNGIGIAPENHARLFRVFQRLVTQDQYEGTGIGLAACRRIIEHHGGRIWVESQVDKGCTFRISLPMGDDLS